MSRTTADALRALMDVQFAQASHSMRRDLESLERLNEALNRANAAVRAVEQEDGSR